MHVRRITSRVIRYSSAIASAISDCDDWLLVRIRHGELEHASEKPMDSRIVFRFTGAL